MTIKVTAEQLEAINQWKGADAIYKTAYEGLLSARVAFYNGTMAAEDYLAVRKGVDMLQEAVDAAMDKATAACEGLELYFGDDFTTEDAEQTFTQPALF